MKYLRYPGLWLLPALMLLNTACLQYRFGNDDDFVPKLFDTRCHGGHASGWCPG